MLPSQFNPLNSFGIDGDIFVSFNLSPYTGVITDINFYNLNPNRKYNDLDNQVNNRLEFPFNFGGAIKSSYKYPDIHYFNDGSENNISYIHNINFYNFNQSILSLLVWNPVGFLANCYQFNKFNFDGDINIVFSDSNYVFDYMFCFDVPDNNLPENFNMSNVMIDFFTLKEYKEFYTQELGSEGSAKYMFYGMDFFNNEKTFKKINLPFLYFDNLNYLFAVPTRYHENGIGTDINKGLYDLLNYALGTSTLTGDNMVKTIDGMMDGRYLENNFYTNNPNGFIDSAIQFHKLDSAINAFTNLAFNESDITNLLNALPAKTDGKEHQITMGRDDNTVTYDKANEYISEFNKKGWTASINLVI